MAPHKAVKLSTLSPEELQEIQELQELYDCPNEIKQRDLEEILEAQYRIGTTRDELRLLQDDLDSLRTQLEKQLILGMPVEPGRVSIATAADGKVSFVWSEAEIDWECREEIPF
jgi:hypothetical protein